MENHRPAVFSLPTVPSPLFRPALAFRTCECKLPDLLRGTEFVLAMGIIREGMGARAVLSYELGPSGLLSTAEAEGTGAVAARRINGEGRSGSSIIHFAGVAASRYAYVEVGIELAELTCEPVLVPAVLSPPPYVACGGLGNSCEDAEDAEE